MARWQSQPGVGPRVIVISGGKRESNRLTFAAHPGELVLLQNGQEVSELFRAYGTPTAVLIDVEARVASAVAAGAQSVRALQLEARAQPDRIGLPAPEISGKTAGGQSVNLAEFRGREVVILFWNPGCQFCRKMVDDLIAWDAVTRYPALLVVTPREDDALQARSLRSRIIIDQEDRIASSYNAGGTPTALRIGADGLIKSQLARGKDSVMMLMRETGVRASAASRDPEFPFSDFRSVSAIWVSDRANKRPSDRR